jgi:hypothetical protein
MLWIVFLFELKVIVGRHVSMRPHLVRCIATSHALSAAAMPSLKDVSSYIAYTLLAACLWYQSRMLCSASWTWMTGTENARSMLIARMMMQVAQQNIRSRRNSVCSLRRLSCSFSREYGRSHPPSSVGDSRTAISCCPPAVRTRDPTHRVELPRSSLAGGRALVRSVHTASVVISLGSVYKFEFWKAAPGVFARPPLGLGYELDGMADDSCTGA